MTKNIDSGTIVSLIVAAVVVTILWLNTPAVANSFARCLLGG